MHLVSQRLEIRPWQSADRPALQRMSSDPDMMRHLTGGRPWTDEDLDAFVARQHGFLRSRRLCMGPLVERASGAVCGIAGLQPLDDGSVELGWWVWKTRWGRGYAPEAARASIRHARDALGLARLVAVIDPANRASIRVAEKLGMRRHDLRSARSTMARREDRPVLIYDLELDQR
jgi:RimJ/RimL family protein N-acetyltransferase